MQSSRQPETDSRRRVTGNIFVAHLERPRMVLYNAPPIGKTHVLVTPLLMSETKMSTAGRPSFICFSEVKDVWLQSNCDGRLHEVVPYVQMFVLPILVALCKKRKTNHNSCETIP